jgi:hypothetical protein
LLASGLPETALYHDTNLEAHPPRNQRANPCLDHGRAREAKTELEEILAKAPEYIEAQILDEQAKMRIGPERERAAGRSLETPAPHRL